MAANAASSSAVIAGRSQTSTRPVSSCLLSSASNPGHSGPGGDTGPAARRCSHARCLHPDPHQCGTRPRAATTTLLPHHPHATTSGRRTSRAPRAGHRPSIPGTSHLPCQRLSRNQHTSCTPVPAPCGRNVVRNQEGCRWTPNHARAAAGQCTGPGGAAEPAGAPKPAAEPPTKNAGPPPPGPSPSASCSGKPPTNPAPPNAWTECWPPRACREVLNSRTTLAANGQLDTGAHTATLTALGRLVHTLTGDEDW